MPARVPRRLEHHRLRLAHLHFLPLGDPHADPGDAFCVVRCPDDDAALELVAELGVAADVVPVVVRVQNQIQPAPELRLDEFFHGRRLGGVDDGDGPRGAVDEHPGIVVAEAGHAEDGEATEGRRGQGAAGRGLGLWQGLERRRRIGRDGGGGGGGRHRCCRCRSLQSTTRRSEEGRRKRKRRQRRGRREEGAGGEAAERGKQREAASCNFFSGSRSRRRRLREKVKKKKKRRRRMTFNCFPSFPSLSRGSFSRSVQEHGF